MLAEVQQRQRNLKLAEVSLFAKLLARGFGIPAKEVERQIDLFTLELYQDLYRPSVIETLRELQQMRKKRVMADAALLQRVDALTVADEKPQRRKKSRR